MVLDGLRFFSPGVAKPISLTQMWILFNFSTFVALIFLTIGAFVWLYARDRRLALLLFLSSLSMMSSFAVQTAGTLNDPLLSTIGDVSSAISLYLFLMLLLLFPRNFLSRQLRSVTTSGVRLQPGQQHYYKLLLGGYVAIVSIPGIIVVVHNALYYLLPVRLPDWLNTIDYSYYLLVLTGILVTIIVSYRRSSLRERQQLRLFVFGVILAFTPFLLLTLLPLILNLPPQYIVDAQLSTLTAILLPLALGYTILRYQILVFDMYIRRAVAWIVGGVSLAVLSYFVVMLSSLFLSNNTTANVIGVAAALVILGPCVWWLAHVSTGRMFFNEMAHYDRLVNNPDLLNRETFNLQEASELLTLAVVNAFETQEVCLFVLDEDTGCYQLSPALNEVDLADSSRRQLVQLLIQAVRSAESGDPSLASLESGDWLGANVPLIHHVDKAKRPLLLSEASKTDAEQPTGLARYLSTTVSEGADPLLAPVRMQGKMIGLLVLGERGDHQQYAGPDFEAIHLIVGRFSPVLETARLYQHASRHVATLNTLYTANAMLEKAYSSIEEVALAYATVAAEAVGVGAEIWLHEETTGSLNSAGHQGPGPRLIAQESLVSLQERDRSACFYDRGGSTEPEKNTSTDIPSCLSQAPQLPFAWLPLSKGEQQFGILTLAY